MAQSVERLTLDSGSGHDLTARGFEPRLVLCADSAEPAWDSLSLSPCLSAPPLLAISLSKKKKKRISYFWLLCKYRSLSAGGRLCFLMEVSSLAFKGADSGYAALQITAFA